jgi:hypothetical protein
MVGDGLCWVCSRPNAITRCAVHLTKGWNSPPVILCCLSLVNYRVQDARHDVWKVKEAFRKGDDVIPLDSC